MDWIIFTAIIVKVLFVIIVLLTFAAILTWVERKQSAVTQDRVGANRVEVFGFRALGMFHIITDAMKMFIKEDYVPGSVNKMIHFLAPFFPMVAALSAFAVIPFGDDIVIGGRKISLAVASLDSGIIYLFAFSSIAVFGPILAGWSSHEKYALIGAMRGAAQSISYEIAIGVSVVGVILVYLWKQIPFIGLIVLAVLQSIGNNYEELSRSLGANRWQAFRYVLLPLIIPGILPASIICFAYAFGSYEVPYLLGKTFPTMLSVLSYRFYVDVDLDARPEAMAISIFIAVFVTILVVFYHKFIRRITGRS